MSKGSIKTKCRKTSPVTRVTCRINNCSCSFSHSNAVSLSLQDGVVIQTQFKDDSALCLKKKHYGRHRSSLVYGGFLQSSTTTHGKREGHGEASEVSEVNKIMKRRYVVMIRN